MIELHEVLTREFQEQGFGRLETSLGKTKPWPIDQEASHHLGTTRMGEDPKTSVVNTNCRLHHTENLFVAGGSVFPTSSSDLRWVKRRIRNALCLARITRASTPSLSVQGNRGSSRT